MAPPQAPHHGAWWPRINVSLQAVAQVLLVIGLGVWLTARRGFDRKALTAVSELNWHVLIPALMFSSIVGAVTPTNLVLLWPLVVLSLVHVVLGILPALLLCWAARLPSDLRFFTVMSCSLPNCGNLPWLFMPTIIRYFTPSADQAAAGIQYSIGLTSVYTITIMIITITVPFLVKRPPDTLVLPRNAAGGGGGGGSTERHSQHSVDRDQPGAQQHLVLDQHLERDQPGAEHLNQPTTGQQQQQQQQQHGAGATGATAWVVPAAHAVVGCQQIGSKPAGVAVGGPATVLDVAVLAGRDQDTAAQHPLAQEPSGGALRHMTGQHQHQHQQLQQHQQQQRHPQLHDAGPIGAGLQQQPLAPGAPGPTTAPSRLSPFEVLGGSADGDDDDDGTDEDIAAVAAAAAAALAAPRHQPYVGSGDSFASHRSGSLLLQHSRQLAGSFSRSFSRSLRGSFSRGLKRSASLVQLVWSFPAGWQPQRRRGAGQRQRQQQQQQQQAATGGPGWWWLRVQAAWHACVAHPVVNLPLGATLVGLVCAAIGPVRGVLVNEGAPLHWLHLGLSWVGAAAAPLATLQIGSELMAAAPGTSPAADVPWRVQWTATAIAITVKLVVVPLLNMALLRLAGMATLVPASDSVYQLLMLVEGCVPAAVTLLVICSRVYPGRCRPLSSMLFWQYVASLFTLPAFLVWFLYMLEL